VHPRFIGVGDCFDGGVVEKGLPIFFRLFEGVTERIESDNIDARARKKRLEFFDLPRILGG